MSYATPSPYDRLTHGTLMRRIVAFVLDGNIVAVVRGRALTPAAASWNMPPGGPPFA